MAKSPRRPAGKPSAPTSRASARDAGRPPSTSAPSASQPLPAPPSPRPHHTAYLEALALYEQGMRSLQDHDFAGAADLLRQVVGRFASERDLVERARLYLGVCERHLTPPAAEPENSEQRLYAATLAMNDSEFANAIRYLERVSSDEPANDRALYMLAVAYSQQGQPDLAIRYLRQAIAANAENRALARVDPDLAPLRAVDGVVALLAHVRPQETSRRRH